MDTNKVYIAFVTSDNRTSFLYGDNKEILESEVAEILEFDQEAIVVNSTMNLSDFLHQFNESFTSVAAFESPKKALDWVIEKEGNEFVLEAVGEYEAEKFLKKGGYEVFEDIQTAVSDLKFHIASEIGQKATTHKNLAEDALDAVEQLADKKGWLHVLQILEDAQ